MLTEPCPYCSGTGVIKSSSTICYEILTEVKKIGSDLERPRRGPAREPRNRARAEGRRACRDVGPQNALGKDVTIRPDTHLHHEQFDLMAT